MSFTTRNTQRERVSERKTVRERKRERWGWKEAAVNMSWDVEKELGQFSFLYILLHSSL